MAPKYVHLPQEAEIYRGDDWALRFQFSEDVSTYTFALQLRRTKSGPVVVEVDIDDTEAGGTAPFYIDATIDGADTATIVPDLLEGDLQVSATETWLRFTIPVKGQFTIPVVVP